jgi:hypothetical protein
VELVTAAVKSACILDFGLLLQNIPSLVLSSKLFPRVTEFDEAIMAALWVYDTEHRLQIYK